MAPVRITGAGTAIMVPAESRIRTVAGLKDRSIATNRGSIGHALVGVAGVQGWSAGIARRCTSCHRTPRRR
ncbi:MAG: hypothetical protein ACRYHQ_20605 [Janthinobacterium lividum]